MLPLPADPEERRVAMARWGLRGLPGQTRTTSSWHCTQMTWFSVFSPTLLQPICSPVAWIFIPALIWRTSRMSAPVSCSSMAAAVALITHGFCLWRQRLLPHLLISGVCMCVCSSPLRVVSRLVSRWCCSLYALLRAWLAAPRGWWGRNVNSCGNMSGNKIK